MIAALVAQSKLRAYIHRTFENVFFFLQLELERSRLRDTVGAFGALVARIIPFPCHVLAGGMERTQALMGHVCRRRHLRGDLLAGALVPYTGVFLCSLRRNHM